MTSETQEIPLSVTLKEQAAQVRPSDVALTAVTAVFFAIGWFAGTVWLGIVITTLWLGRSLTFGGSAIRYGYRSGAHVPVAPAPPAGPVRGRPGPGGTLIEE